MFGLPIILIVVIVILGASALLGLFYRLSLLHKKKCLRQEFLSALSSFAMVVTLIAVMAYTFYTYAIVKATYAPVITYALDQPFIASSKLEDRCLIHFIVLNSSNYPTTCWCNVTATVYGQPIAMEGFYAKKSPLNIQPKGRARGYFNIKDIVNKASRDMDQMVKGSPAVANPKEQLRFTIDFWYHPNDRPNDKIVIPSQSYYFDFNKGILVSDF